MLKNFRCHHRRNPRSDTHPAGLSLMELMIAIVIILVLVAITVPAVRALRERAQSAQCVQNLRQIGVALQAHISENGGRFPNGKAHVSWLKDDDNSSLGLSWYDAAANHMGREKFSNRFNDPNADPLPEAFGCPSGHGKAYHPAWPYTGDYAGNLYLGQSNQGVMTISAVKNPAATPYVQDTVKQNNFGAWIFGSGFSQTADAAFAARHRGKGNILWVDGRVTSLSHAEYMKLANNNRYGGVLNFMKGNW